MFIVLLCLYYRGRILAKKLNIRIEHIKHSNCRLDFLKRMKDNEAKKVEARAAGTKVQLKRQPTGPRPAHFVNARTNKPQIVEPIRYEFIA